MQRMMVLVLAGILLMLLACGSGEGPVPEGSSEAALTPQLPDPEAGRALRWSPKGEQLPLTLANGALVASLSLGDGGDPLELRLGRSGAFPQFDLLSIDLNRNGELEADERFETVPEEIRNKFWSSFDAVVAIPVTDPWSGDRVNDAYPLSLWYVEDPRAAEPEEVLRYSRRGWMEGPVTLGGVDAVVMLTEGVMDGVFGAGDYWALAPRDSAQQVLSFEAARPVEEHAWLHEEAYRLTDIDPSGRRVILTPADPGMTRAEEAKMNDFLAVDREAPRSGRSVAFLHDFEEARARAAEEGKRLFVDFETTWCGPCKTMDEWVYTADAVVDAAASLVAVKVDGDDFPELKERFEVEGFPTMILLAPDGAEVQRLSGYVSVAGMTEFLEAGGK